MAIARRVMVATLACVVMSGCGKPEDPARVELRALLEEEARLSDDNVKRLIDELGRSIEGKTFRIKEGTVTRELDEGQRAVIFNLLVNPSGTFDQGLQVEGGGSCRMLNSPGAPLNAEIEGTNKLCVDVETFLPRHFKFFYAVPGFGDYEFDLVEAR